LISLIKLKVKSLKSFPYDLGYATEKGFAIGASSTTLMNPSTLYKKIPTNP